MTGIVLALAGLTCGDGGPGTSAATEPVSVNAELLLRFEGTWEGTWEGYAGDKRFCFPVTVKGDKISLEDERPGDGSPFAVTLEGRGAIRLRILGETHPGIYRPDRGRLLICVGVANHRPTAFMAAPGSDLFTLRPAIPRKP
jgi:hypothetical protein